MQVWNMLHTARWKHRTQNNRQKSPSGHHHHTTLSSQLRHVSTIGKNLLSSNMSSTGPYNMVNFGPIAAEFVFQFGAPLQIWMGFASSQRYCTASSSGRQPNFAALNRGRHLWSAGRPSRWALAHIQIVTIIITNIVIIHEFASDHTQTQWVLGCCQQKTISYLQPWLFQICISAGKCSTFSHTDANLDYCSHVDQIT